MSGLPSEPFRGGGDLRASDSDRDRIALVLRQAAEDGRLDFGELEDRLDRVLRAKTYDDLQQITDDLPLAEFHSADSEGAVLPARRVSEEISAVFKKVEVTGHWLVPARMSVRVFGTEAVLDLTDAVMPNEVVIDANVAMGTLRLTVPEEVAVEMEDSGSFLASRNDKTSTKREPGTPTIRVRGSVVLGELTVRPPRRTWFRRKRRQS